MEFGFLTLLSTLAGCYVILSLLFTLLRSFWMHHVCVHKLSDLSRLYGRGSWAVVTGASRGLGLAFCAELARQGFNLVMAARSLQAMQENAEQIRQKYQGVQVKVVAADLGSQRGVDELIGQIAGLDVSILVSNAGTMQIDSFVDLKESDINNIVNLNINANVQMVTATRKIFATRNRPHSAVIVTSSLTSSVPFPYLNLYAPTKAFLSSYFGKTIEEAADRRVDLMVAEYGAVATDMVPFPAIPGIIADAESTIKSTLVQLGHRTRTYGTMMHDVQDWLLKTELIINSVGLFGLAAKTPLIRGIYESSKKKHK